MAHSLANTDNHDEVPMSEGVDVEDAADRAQRKRKYGVTREFSTNPCDNAASSQQIASGHADLSATCQACRFFLY